MDSNTCTYLYLFSLAYVLFNYDKRRLDKIKHELLNIEFKPMLIYSEDVDISELKRQRADWDVIDRKAILSRFNLHDE